MKMKDQLKLLGILLKISLLFGLLNNFYIKVEGSKTPDFQKYPDEKGKVLSLDERVLNIEVENQLYKTEISLLKTKLDDGISSISKLEVENMKQKSENSILKTKIGEDSKEIQELKHRISKLEARSFTNCSKRENKDNILDLKKRPARLLPLQLLFNNRNDSEEIDQKLPSRFVGPPNNCSELGKLGYTLNGYYLVKQNYTTNKNKIGIVYCAFRQEQGLMNKQVLQTPVGKVEVKTMSVYFHARMTENRDKGILKFKNIHVNEGDAFNETVFTAPVAGTYHFSFYGAVFNASSDFKISATIDGVLMENVNPKCSNCSTQLLYFAASYHLKEGNTLWLFKHGNISSGTVAGGNKYQSHSNFFGWLLEEDMEED